MAKTPQSQIGALPDGGPPPPDDGVLDDLISAGAISLDSFTTTASTLPPCGGPPATLNWRITEHPERTTSNELRQALIRVFFTLRLGPTGEVNVPAVGSRQVHLPLTSTFVLSAKLGRAAFVLGMLTIRIDRSLCGLPETVTVDQLRPMVQTAAEQFLREFGARLRSSVGLDIGENGIHVSLAIVRPGTVDVNVDVDAVFQLYPKDCAINLVYARYNVDADLPWWLYLVDPLIVGVIEAFLSAEIGNKLRAGLLNRFQSFLASFIPPDRCVCSVGLTQGQLSILVCPR